MEWRSLWISWICVGNCIDRHRIFLRKLLKPLQLWDCYGVTIAVDLLDLCGKLYRPAQNILEEIAETLALRHISYINHRIAWRAGKSLFDWAVNVK